MNKTLILAVTCLMLLGGLAAAPTATADHAPDSMPRENGTCVYNPFVGRVCGISDDGWCWIVWHCPW